MNILKISVEEQTRTIATAFLSTLSALVPTSLLAADFSNTAYELKDRN